LLNDIARVTNSVIKEIEPPSLQEMKEHRGKQLAEKVEGILTKSKNLKPYYKMVETVTTEIDCEPEDLAAALAYLLDQNNPVPEQELKPAKSEPRKHRERGNKSFDRKKPAFRSDRKSSDKGKRRRRG